MNMQGLSRPIPADTLFVLNRSVAAIHNLKDARYLPLFERVKTATAWNALGLDVHQHKTDDYCLDRIFRPTPGEAEALRTGKRYALHFFVLLDYFKVGVPFDEFTTHPQHWRDYCLGVVALEEGRLEDARDLLGAAVVADPGEVRYLESWFRVRFALQDDSAAEECLEAFANDMDWSLMVGWVKLLLKRKLYGRCAAIIVQTDQLLSEIAAGTRKRHYYGQQPSSYSAYQVEQFRKWLTKLSASPRNRPLFAEIDRLAGVLPVQ
ncbi:MAG: hypothetical protein LBG66_02695 [Gallionellaceae bacterium]|jgi:hypothetical protein|nr:hypothetical protein [Gallionellaceae bacterium]